MSLQKVLSSLAVISLIFLPLVASANSYIPGVGPDSSLPEYIKAIYSYAIGVVGILATVVIMIGGIIWISSMGNAGRVSEAKAWIGAALTGLALAMFSYTILYIVNPDLVNFQWQGPQTINTGNETGPGDDKNNINGCYISGGLCVPATSAKSGESSFVPGGVCVNGSCVSSSNR